MDDLTGVYAGRIISLGDGNASVFVPQVFGDTPIVVSDFLAQPQIGMGWVAFQAGHAEHPVWLSGLPVASDSGSGFTFVQEEPPVPTEEGETWYRPSDGTAWVAIGPADALVWVSFPTADEDQTGFSFIQDTLPTATTGGQTWYNTANGDSFVWVVDGTSSQWVQFAGGESGGSGGGGGGDGGTLSFTHNQGVTDDVWDIVHNLGWYPNVTVIDSGGSTVEGELDHLSTNSLRLTFSGAFTGIAYLS